MKLAGLLSQSAQFFLTKIRNFDMSQSIEYDRIRLRLEQITYFTKGYELISDAFYIYCCELKVSICGN